MGLHNKDAPTWRLIQFGPEVAGGGRVSTHLAPEELVAGFAVRQLDRLRHLEGPLVRAELRQVAGREVAGSGVGGALGAVERANLPPVAFAGVEQVDELAGSQLELVVALADVVVEDHKGVGGGAASGGAVAERLRLAHVKIVICGRRREWRSW